MTVLKTPSQVSSYLHVFICKGIPPSTAALSTACPIGEFRCDESRCILLSSVCDQNPDCSDGTDEADCKSKFYFLRNIITSALIPSAYLANRKYAVISFPSPLLHVLIMWSHHMRDQRTMKVRPKYSGKRYSTYEDKRMIRILRLYYKVHVQEAV